jgi:hypothetical protein
MLVVDHLQYVEPRYHGNDQHQYNNGGYYQASPNQPVFQVIVF